MQWDDYKKVRGRPRITWLSMITEEIKTVLKIDVCDALEMATIMVINYWNNAKLRQVFVIFTYAKLS